jgi:hypothetical protein
MNATHNDQLKGVVEEPQMKLSSQAAFQRPVRPWHQGAVCRSIAATALGLATLGAVRSLLAQPPSSVQVPQAPGNSEPPPFAPVKVGRYYVNIPAVCYAYWAAPREGDPRAFVLEFGQGTRLILSAEEGGLLSEVFPTLRAEGPPPARLSGEGLLPPPVPSGGLSEPAPPIPQ